MSEVNVSDMSDMKDEIVEHTEELVDNAREMLEELDDRVRTVVREHPFLTLFGALVGGYAVGRLFARR